MGVEVERMRGHEGVTGVKSCRRSGARLRLG